MITWLAVLSALLWGIVSPDWGRASVTGACDDCHVMHFSQVGLVPAQLLALGAGPQEHLLNNTCLGCHTGTNTGLVNATPMVYTTGATELAGGNFKYSDITNQRYGHNPGELDGGADITLLTPPGWKTGFLANGQVGTINNGVAATRLRCAGTYGCHGQHSDTGIYGSHHNHPTSASGINAAATTTGNSYRFLYQIKGYEDADYEASDSTTNHNVYYGVVRGSDTPTDTQTMSYLCAECHGIFHSDGGGANEGVAGASFASPWIRHPVDISMPSPGSGDFSGYTTYRTEAPVASTTLTTAQHTTATTSVAGANNRIVMCLSCHRAHASPYHSSMRWDNRASNAGCAYCHTAKD